MAPASIRAGNRFLINTYELSNRPSGTVANLPARNELRIGANRREGPFVSPEMKVVRATFRAGQFIPVHAPDVHVALYIIPIESQTLVIAIG